MTFTKVVVVGGGVIGSQIAFQTAYCGFDVTILLVDSEDVKQCKIKIEKLKNVYLYTMNQMKIDKTNYPRGFTTTKTELTNDKIEELMANVRDGYSNIIYTTDIKEACNNADLVIEAIAEDLQQKKELFTKINKYLPEKTIIVTNSSTLLPSQLADSTGRPEKFLALHFGNNIWKLNIAEVMMHPGTNPDNFEVVLNFAKQINMVPMKIYKEQKGYILNSLLIPLMKSALTLWANGVADPETIDKSWKLGTGALYGPFRMLDVIGLNTAYNIFLLNPNDQNIRIAKKLKVMIDAGKLGIATGEGFYKY